METETVGLGSTIFNVQKSSSDTKISSKISRFFQRTVKCVVIMAGTILFPFTMIAVLVSDLHYSYGHAIKRSEKFKGSLKRMMFVLPVVGSIFSRKFCNGLFLCGKRIASKKDMKHPNFLYTCIPFLSSYMASTVIADYIFDKKSTIL